MKDFLSVFLEFQEASASAQEVEHTNGPGSTVNTASSTVISAPTQLPHSYSRSSLLSHGMKTLDLTRPAVGHMVNIQTAGHLSSHAPLNTAAAPAGNHQQQQQVDMTAMFEDWDAPKDRDEKQTLEEALDLLPDLDAMLTVPAHGRPGMMMGDDDEEDQPGLPAMAMRGGYGIPAQISAAIQQHMMMAGNGGVPGRQPVPAISPLTMFGL